MTKINVIQTEVPCPHCGKPLCNLCAFNGMCEQCLGTLYMNTADKVAEWIKEHRDERQGTEGTPRHAG